MRRKIVFLVGFVIFFIAVGGGIYFATKSVNDNELRVQDYFPKQEMIKKFSGGFENGGFTHIIDKIENGKAQVKKIDTAVGIVSIYNISENEISVIYSQEIGDGKFEKNYLDTVIPNMNNIILKAPLKIGTKWTNDGESNYEITGVNVKIKTSVGILDAIEVTFTRGDFVVKEYYVKELGLVKRIIKDYGVDELVDIKYINQE